MELTILMPCLNEEETIGICIKKAKKFLESNGIDGEVLIADNGSEDNSVSIALSMGARVIHVTKKGYGSALIAGCNASLGEYVIMGDADDSYDFEHLELFVEKLRAGYELVMGNRFAGGIEKGAMPFSHKYIGNPVLSFIGRLFFKSKIKDFHCGLRGYRRESILKLNLKTSGMEYASEMVVMSELNGLKITEVPTTLKKDGRSRKPHLRTFSDGWRHLKFLFMYCPKWLFLYPGIALCAIGLVGGISLIFGNLQVGKVILGIHTLLYCRLLLMLGINIVLLYIYTKIYACKQGFIPKDTLAERFEKYSVEKGIVTGILLLMVGVVLSIMAVSFWKHLGYTELIPEQIMRVVIPASALIEIGAQFVFSSFFIGILNIGIEKGNNENEKNNKKERKKEVDK